MAYFFGQWIWNDGSQNDYGYNDSTLPTVGIHPWAFGQPNITAGFEHCVHLSREWGYRWDDISCIERRNYPICSDDGTGDVLYESIEPFQPRSNNLITYIDVTDSMHFEMTVVIKSFPQEWANIFHCGSTDEVRMPSIYIHPNSGDPGATWEGFLVVWSTKDDWNSYISLGPALEVDRSYHLEFDVQQNRCRLKVNGQEVYRATKRSHEKLSTVPCYASNPWDTSADVIIQDVMIAPEAEWFVEESFCCNLDDVLLSNTKKVRDLSIACLVCDYFFVICVLILCCYFCSENTLDDMKYYILFV